MSGDRPEKEQNTLSLLNTAIAHVSDSIEVTDADGHLQYVNLAFETLTGYSANEVLGQKPSILKSGLHDRAFYENFWGTITAGRTWQGRFTNRRKDGDLIEMDASITPVFNSLGAITHYVAVKRDVTKELKRQDKLLDLQKMEALATLAGGIAHDFNNILTGILGYTELSRAKVNSNSEIYDHLGQVLKAGLRAKELVNQILSFSRQDDSEHKPTQIAPVIMEVLRLLRSTIPTTIDIRQHIASDAIVTISSTHLHQVIMNLCTNAYQAMEKTGGVLDVGIKDEQLGLDDLVTYPSLGPGTYARLTVSDTGPGIPPETLKRIFDPYFTTKDKSKGTGLGLAVIQGIIHGCGGDIRAYSELDNGTTFQVLLPSARDVGYVSTEPDYSMIHHGSGERLLFVDDEQLIVDLGEKMLQRLGYKVDVRTSSIEALKAFEAKPQAYDLVLTDMTMPNMTGDKLAEELKKIRPGIPIILCTGFSERISKEKARAMGINAFLLKPIAMDTLAATIKNALKTR